jgi:tyrosine-specific transport protein
MRQSLAIFMSVAVETKNLVKKSYWTASMLVSGACIGGGMLAMPIQTAEAGFFVSFFMLVVCWIFMAFTGLLLVESTLWFKENAHFSSLAMGLLGRWGRAMSLGIYLFMNYASLVAYTAGGAALIDSWFYHVFHISLGYTCSCVLFTLIFGSIVYLGSLLIGKINSLLMMAMILAYLSLVSSGAADININHLTMQASWRQGLFSVPLILAAYSYQMIVPSLCSYLNYDLKALKKSILIGTTLPFLVYATWLFVIHGAIPFEGADGLKAALIRGSSATEPLKAHFKTPFLALLADSFAFFALVTSYLSLSLALFDFIRDLFKSFMPHEKNPNQFNKNKILILSLVPSLLLAISYPRALLEFLDLSGGFGDVFLSGLIPISMVWVGRYRKKMQNTYETPGGKSALLLAGSFAILIFMLTWIKLFSQNDSL